MKILNLLKIIFHIFISFYIIFFFYWQSKNYELVLYSVPFVLKIGVPVLIKGFCYLNMDGRFSGILIDFLDDIFIKKLNMNIEYVYQEKNYEFCDCIINILCKEDNDNFFIQSNSIFSKLVFLEINKKNSKNKKIVSIKNDILYFIDLNLNNITYLNSLEDAAQFLELNSDYYLLISENYYNNCMKKIEEKFILKNYDIKKIEKNFNKINLLFNYKLYWLINFFNIVLEKKIKEII